MIKSLGWSPHSFPVSLGWGGTGRNQTATDAKMYRHAQSIGDDSIVLSSLHLVPFRLCGPTRCWPHLFLFVFPSTGNTTDRVPLQGACPIRAAEAAQRQPICDSRTGRTVGTGTNHGPRLRATKGLIEGLFCLIIAQARPPGSCPRSRFGAEPAPKWPAEAPSSPRTPF